MHHKTCQVLVTFFALFSCCQMQTEKKLHTCFIGCIAISSSQLSGKRNKTIFSDRKNDTIYEIHKTFSLSDCFSTRFGSSASSQNGKHRRFIFFYWKFQVEMLASFIGNSCVVNLKCRLNSLQIEILCADSLKMVQVC